MVYKVLILGVQNQRLKENLKRVAWGLDVGQEDRTRIESLMFAFALFTEICFLFLQVILFNANYLYSSVVLT